MGRSILAVVAGFVATIVLSVACDAVVRGVAPASFGTDGRTPGPVMMAVGVFYTLVCAAIGGYLTALIARRAEVLHALTLGTFGALASLVIVLATPQRTAAQLVSTMLVLPVTVLGGWLRSVGRAKS